MINLSNKKILITGANGFVGINLIDRLLLEGAVIGVMVAPNENLDILNSKLDNIYIEDLRNAEGVLRIIKDFSPDIIYHLAAVGSVPYSKEHSKETIDVNFGGTFNLLEAVKNIKIERFIYISSAEVYQSSDISVTETSLLYSSSPYAASKIAADFLITSYHQSYNLPAVILRPCNLYGPSNSKNVIYKFIKTALSNEDINMEGGSQLKTFLYIDDFVRSLLLLAKKEEAIGEIFNIGSKIKITIKELAEKIILFTGSSSKINIVDARNIGTTNLSCNSTKLENLLNWKEEITLDEGLIRNINWLKLKNKNAK